MSQTNCEVSQVKGDGSKIPCRLEYAHTGDHYFGETQISGIEPIPDTEKPFDKCEVKTFKFDGSPISCLLEKNHKGGHDYGWGIDVIIEPENSSSESNPKIKQKKPKKRKLTPEEQAELKRKYDEAMSKKGPPLVNTIGSAGLPFTPVELNPKRGPLKRARMVAGKRVVEEIQPKSVKNKESDFVGTVGAAANMPYAPNPAINKLKIKTEVSIIPPLEYKALCGTIHKLFPQLQWRHNGLGLLQAYIQEDKINELRIHIWHPSLIKPGIQESGLVHDHRFDLISYVLLGSIRQVEYNLTMHPEGEWELQSVAHRREQIDSKLKVPDHITKLEDRYNVETVESKILEGQKYFYGKKLFHATYAEGLTITLIMKRNQEDFQARILSPIKKPIVHAFEDSMLKESWQGVVREAQHKLFTVWKQL